MIQFILNEHPVQTEQPSGMVLLDFIRYHQGLMGTKIGCREGDCGACTVLLGTLTEQGLLYQSANSCLTPLAKVAGKQVVTIEGLNLPAKPGEKAPLNAIQQAMVTAGATQCGFCTPGFVVSLAGYFLNHQPERKLDQAIAAIDGNICRCTGYKSIEKTADDLLLAFPIQMPETHLDFLVAHQFIPPYFKKIKEKLPVFKPALPDFPLLEDQPVGGGTDLYVQKPEDFHHREIRTIEIPDPEHIWQYESNIHIKASTTIAQFCSNHLVKRLFPGIGKMAKLVASTPIRNQATLAGNLINASPIGDFSILLLALPASLVIQSNSDGGNTKERRVSLRQFFKGYKKVDLVAGEALTELVIEMPGDHFQLHFEKVSKRTHLDIASVNTACCLSLAGQKIQYAALTAGGVGPVPLYLAQSSQWLMDNGEQLDKADKLQTLWMGCLEIAEKEIAPISDARGSATYKRLLLRQLITAHFLHFFPLFKPDFASINPPIHPKTEAS